jgi:hypothetical protein
MSAARLEIIKDDDEPIQICRSMPAALEGLVSRKGFCDFCDKLDDSLQLLDQAHTRCKKRIWWKWVSLYLWIFFFSFGLTSYVQVFDSILLYVLGYLFLLCVILSSIDYFVNWDVPRDALSEKQLMRKLRRDCEDMTLRTPHVSFHIVLQPVPPFQLKFLALDVVDHIAVSLAFAATNNQGISAGGGRVIASLMTDDHNDHHDDATARKILDHAAATGAAVTPTTAMHPVVFAEAISGGHAGAYRRVASDDNDSNVDLV